MILSLAPMDPYLYLLPVISHLNFGMSISKRKPKKSHLSKPIQPELEL